MQRIPFHLPADCDVLRAVEEGRADGDLGARLHTRVPIEGAGVVHVVTDPDVAATDVILWRYRDNTPIECAHLTGSVGGADMAKDMHTYWCDLETLSLCVMGVPYALHIIDMDYFDRKWKEIFGAGLW